MTEPAAQPTRDQLERMFFRMALSRQIEKLMARHVREHRFSGWWHPGEGQEAAPIGATAAMRDDDYLWYQGRGTAWSVGKGMSVDPILGDLLGKTTGSTGGKGGGVPHWRDRSIGVMGEGATLGSVFPLAAGSALASKIRGTDQVSLADFGDGTAARGTFHEALVHAAAWKLPVIYFCENNGFLVGTRLGSVSPTEDIADYAAGYHIPGVIVDGQDAVATYQVTAQAIARARAGEGPTLIEAKVFRRQGHYAGDPQNYRDVDHDLKSYRDPLDVLGIRLASGTAEMLQEKAAAVVLAAYEAAMAAPEPDESVIWKDLFYER